MKGNQFNIFIFMLPIGNQSSNVAKKKKNQRNLLMKLNGNLLLTLTECKRENGAIKMFSKC